MPETSQIHAKSAFNCQWPPSRPSSGSGQSARGKPDAALRRRRRPADSRGGELDWIYIGRPGEVHVVQVRWLAHAPPDISGSPSEDVEGFLVWGSNSGVRILDDAAEPTLGVVDDHLPRSYGRPIVWVEDADDLPADIRAVVTAPD